MTDKKSEDKLDKLIYAGARKRYGNPLPPTVSERLDTETAAVREHGLERTFLIAHEIAQYAKRHHIMLGPGRGAMAGSLCLYCLGVTDVDPIENSLLFERFLTFAGPGPLHELFFDCGEKSADLIKAHLVKKYGKTRSAFIMTFDETLTRNRLKKEFEYAKDESRIRVKIPGISRFIIPDEDPGNIFGWKYSDEITELFQREREVREIFEFADIAYGIRQPGDRPGCRILVSPGPLGRNIRTGMNTRGDRVAEKEDINEKTVPGSVLVKLCGQPALDLISSCVNEIRKRRSINIALSSLPLDDKETYDALSAGKGLPEMPFRNYLSRGLTRVLKKIKPRTFNEFTAAYALARPWAIGERVPEKYASLRDNPENIELIHPVLAPVLFGTFGLLLYQEQLLSALQVFGYSPEESNQIRKYFAMKRCDMIDELESGFVERAVVLQIGRLEARNIYRFLVKYGEYCFIKAHTAAYSLVLYRMAYLKTHFREEFLHCARLFL